MSRAQQIVEDQNSSAELADIQTAQPMELFPDEKVTMSPARALQARLIRELEPVQAFEAERPVVVGMVAFVAACAGTWGFGVLLYLQF